MLSFQISPTTNPTLELENVSLLQKSLESSVTTLMSSNGVTYKYMIEYEIKEKE